MSRLRRLHLFQNIPLSVTDFLRRLKPCVRIYKALVPKRGEIHGLSKNLGTIGLSNIESVVFSSRTTTLDLIQSALGNSSILCVRVDGRVSARNRTIAFDAFRTNSTVRVILLTISCGAEG
jgi:SNF2 family DNA or RNA helicase